MGKTFFRLGWAFVFLLSCALPAMSEHEENGVNEERGPREDRPDFDEERGRGRNEERDRGREENRGLDRGDERDEPAGQEESDDGFSGGFSPAPESRDPENSPPAGVSDAPSFSPEPSPVSPAQPITTLSPVEIFQPSPTVQPTTRSTDSSGHEYVRTSPTAYLPSVSAYTPADQVTDAAKTWGESAVPKVSWSPSSMSSFQFVVIGEIISINRSKREVVIKDKRRKKKTIYVDAPVLSTLRKGAVIQMSLRPGSNRAENVRQVGW